MGRDAKNETREAQFAKWVKWETELPAWKALSGNAKAAYMHFKIRCRTEGKRLKYNNNGKVALSSRTLAAEMGCNPRTAMTAMAALQAKGWIVCMKRGHLGVHGQAAAPEWRLTMLATETNGKSRLPTYEPKYWEHGHDYPVHEYKSSQKSSPSRGDASRFRPKDSHGATVVRLKR